MSDFRNLIRFGKVRYRCAEAKGKVDCYACKGKACYNCCEWQAVEHWYEKISIDGIAGTLAPLIMTEAVLIIGWAITSKPPTAWSNTMMASTLSMVSGLCYTMMFALPILMGASIVIGAYIAKKDASNSDNQSRSEQQ